MFSPRELERTDALTLFRKEGVPRAEALARLVRPSLVLEPRAGRGEERTRLGGVPDLPAGCAWPKASTGQPMTFIGQLDLRELAATAVARDLPDHGVLAWFYAPDAGPPEHALVWSGERPIERAEPPTGLLVLPEYGAKLTPWWSIPPRGRESPFVAALGFSEEELSEWDELWQAWMLDDDAMIGHRLLGYSSIPEAYLSAALDTDEALRARFFARPVSERSREPFLDGELAARASSFRLLVEIQCIEALGIEWGDGASTAILVHDDAWKRRDFDLERTSRELASICLRS